MKSEERHELKTNEMERLVDHAKPFFEKYTTEILGGLGIFTLVVIGVLYFQLKEPANAQEWLAFYKATISEDAKAVQAYNKIVDVYQKTDVATWATLNAADVHFKNCLNLMYKDHSASKRELEKARAGYRKLVDSEANLPRELKERALFRLAEVAETNCNGKTEKAIKRYQAVIDEYESDVTDSVFKTMAEERIAALRTDRAKEFYAWFSQVNPAPKDSTGIRDGGRPSMGLPPNHPPFGPIIPNPNKKTDGTKSDDEKPAPFPDKPKG